MVFFLLQGLEHLHEHCNPAVIHRDFKSSNILLDASFNAKVRARFSNLPLTLTVVLKIVIPLNLPGNECFLCNIYQLIWEDSCKALRKFPRM